ncbi:MAG: TonB family protein, partial [Myxococcota bacterium]|nr:TonB family protein [Myxococcota bacterium]
MLFLILSLSLAFPAEGEAESSSETEESTEDPAPVESVGPANEVDSVEGTGEGDAPTDSGEAEAIGAFERLPVLVYQPAAVYPAVQLEAGVEDEVLLQLAIDELGEVLDVSVVETGGVDFDAAAVQAARSFRFEPALDAEGTPVPALIQYRYVFRVSAVATLSLEGQVLDPAEGLAIAGALARVTSLSTEETQTAMSDQDGRFSFAGLHTGAWMVRVEFENRVPGETQVEVRDDLVTTVVIYPERVEESLIEGGMEIVVEARRTEVGVTERVLTKEEIRYLPGTSGDVVRVVQNLPGVARPPLNIGQLIIRGVAPEDSAYFIDGGRIPLVFHFAGLTTVVPSDTVAEVAFLPGSFGVRYGRTLGGLVDLRTSPELPEEKRFSYASMD